MTLRLSALFAILLFVSACKVAPAPLSQNLSGPGGDPTQWTCNELKTEYPTYRSQLVAAISAFETEYARLQQAGELNSSPGTTQEASIDHEAPTNQASSSPEVLIPDAIDTDSDPQISATDEEWNDFEAFALQETTTAPVAKIGEGAEDRPALPAAIAALRDINVSAYYSEKNPAECDDILGQFGQSGSTQILEQCRHIVRLYNIAGKIKTEYNYGRDGECRSGKAATQTGQVSQRFPYCENPCRFGQTTCVQCTFTGALLSSSYICGEERDTREAIRTHCDSNGLNCSDIQCSEPKIFNDAAQGTTSIRQSDTEFTAKVTVGRKLEAQFNEGVTVKAHQETKIEVQMKGVVQLKNSRGAPISNDFGGETASFYNCSVEVSAGIIRDVGASVGAGFDVVVASGSATAGYNAELSALTKYKTTSRDIRYSGTLKDVLLNCTTYAENWATNDLPLLFADNVVVRAVASRFMGDTTDAMTKNVTGIYCDSSVGGTTTDTKTYRINKISVALTEDRIEVSATYDGYYNRVNRTSITTKRTQGGLGQSNYVSLRQKIFEDGVDSLTNADIRKLLEGAWVDDDDTFTDCSKTSW